MRLLRKADVDDLMWWRFLPENPNPTNYKLSYYNIFKSKGEFSLLYNTFSGALALLNEKESQACKAYLKTGSLEDDKFSRDLIQNWFAVAKETDERRYMLNELTSNQYLKNRFKQFTILPTQKCNANCFYCFEKDLNRKHMSNSVARETADFILACISQDTDSFNLDWFGGEPLMGLPAIREIIKRVSEKTGLPFSSSMTTNAILFSPELINEAVEQWHLSRVSVTIDGIFEEHNKRKAVSGNVDAFKKTMENIDFLLARNVFVNLRVHFDNYNRFLMDKTFSYMEKYKNNLYFRLYPDKLFMPLQVANHLNPERYINEKDSITFYREMIDCLKDHGLADYVDFLGTRRETSCFATRRDMIMIDSDGKLYNCEQEFYDHSQSFGSVREGIIYNSAYFEMFEGIKDKECSACLYLPSCGGGCRFTKRNCIKQHQHCMRGRITTPLAMDLILEEVIKNDQCH